MRLWARLKGTVRFAVKRAGLPILLAAAVVGLSLFLGGRLSNAVREEGRLLAKQEFAAVASVALKAAESQIDAVTRSLSAIARSAPLSCAEATLAELRKTLAALPAVVNLGLVDITGRLMCSTKGQDAPDLLLPPLSPRAPVVLLVAEPRPNRIGLIVAWTPASGPRLIAEMAPDTPPVPEFPALAGGKIALTIGPSEGGVWRRSGRADFELGPDTDLTTGRGSAYPLAARIETPRGFAPAGFERIAGWVDGAAIALAGLVTLAVAIAAFAWNRRPAAPAAIDGGPPSYRAVIEIDTGRLVGIDLATADAEASAGLGAERIAQVLSDAAPLLSEWPSLKLSFPVSRSVIDRPVERERLTAILEETTIAPSQIVATLDAGRNPRRLHALSGLVRALERTGMHVALTGPDESLPTLLRTKPDFVWLNDPLADSRGSERDARRAGISALAASAGDAGIGVLARAITDPEALEDLRLIGITTATGPIFGSAMPASAMAEIARAAAIPTLDVGAMAG